MYMAADLDEPLCNHCEWFAAVEGGSAVAVVLVFRGLSVPAVLATGDTGGIRHILAMVHADLPGTFYTKVDAVQQILFGTWFHFEDAQPLTVMFLDRLCADPPRPGLETRLLRYPDALDNLATLYNDYPGNFFEPAQVEHNVYFGTWDEGVLAAVAGTHAFAPKEHVAVLGNVVTAVQKRGRGLCRQTCSFLVEELVRRGCRHIGLHVAQENESALRCYRSIGFATHSSLLQVRARRT